MDTVPRTGCESRGSLHRDHIRAAVNRALQEMDYQLNDFMANFQAGNTQSPADMFANTRVPSTEAALQMTQSAEIFERVVTELQNDEDPLSRDDMAMISSMVGCMQIEQPDCSHPAHLKYRSLDGTCNNRKHPMWGATLAPLKRIVPAYYENDFNEPLGWNYSQHSNHSRPSSRYVSNMVMSTKAISFDEDYTHMIMVWGQFHDHDVTFTPTVPISSGCKGICDNSAPCFPIPTPDDDPRIERGKCMQFVRSAAACHGGITLQPGLPGMEEKYYVREQVNQITAYTDASNVYGSTDEESNMLRELMPSIGNMKVGMVSPAGKSYMPYKDTPEGCIQKPGEEDVPCFLAGDKRANEHLALTGVHTIWVREHNRIAEKIRELNPEFNGDTVYHETRKLVGAMHQVITYGSYIPKIIGPAGMELLGEYHGYNEDVDATTINSFATAVYRFGHGQILPETYRFDNNLDAIPEGNLKLHDAFFTPYRIMREGGIDPVLLGSVGVGSKAVLPTQVLSDEVTEQLFALANTVALDLAAINIQRGRDHGLPGYNYYREYCGLKVAETFDDFADEIKDPEVRARLEAVYGHPSNVDLFVGGMVEDWAPGARVGPTFQILLAKQFKAMRDGDRFWYEAKGVFNPAQLAEIRKTTFARVMCDCSDNITHLPLDVFRNTPLSDWTPCDQIAVLDLTPWQGCCEEGFSNFDDCSYSKFNKDDIGFLPSSNCHNFIRCQKSGDDLMQHEFCCPDNLYWHQEKLACTRIDPGTSPYCPLDNSVLCSVIRPDNATCALLPGETASTYVQYVHGLAISMPCPASTLYNPDTCRCDIEDLSYTPTTCSPDPLLHFTFNGDFMDCQCPKAVGTAFGSAKLKQGFPWSPLCPSTKSCDPSAPNCAVCFGEEGGSVEFGYLKNWFDEENSLEFSFSMWFFQTGPADKMTAMIGNGDCYNNPSVCVAGKDGTLWGGIKTESHSAFDLHDGTESNRSYPLNEWVHTGMTLYRRELVLYINGVKVDSRKNVKGGVLNTPVGSTIGMAYLDCIAHRFIGCIDDIRFFDRCVHAEEFSEIYAQGRQ